MVEYFWPPNGDSAAAGQTVFNYNGLVAIGDWRRPLYFLFTGAAFTSGYSLGSYAPAQPNYGVYGMSFNGNDGGWLLDTGAYSGSVSASGINGQLPSGAVYQGLCVDSALGAMFTTGPSGAIYELVPSGYSHVSGFYGLARGIALTSGGILSALDPSNGSLDLYSSGGTLSSIALPSGLPLPSCLAVSGAWAVGGWTSGAYVSGAAALALNPTNTAEVFAFNGGSGWVFTPAITSGYSWMTSNAVSGFATAPSCAAAAPNGLQILIYDGTHNKLQVADFTAGVLSLAQTIALTGITSIAITSTSTNALLADPAANVVVTASAAAGTWATGATLALSGVSCLIPTLTNTIAAGFASGIGQFTYVGGTWSLTASAALSFNPTALFYDTFGYTYAAASGHLAVCSGVTLISSGVVSGNVSALAVMQQQVYAADQTGAIRTLGQNVSGTWSQMASAAAPVGVSGLVLSNNVLLAASSGQTQVFGFGSPYNLMPARIGGVATTSGGAWTYTALNADNHPSALAFDASGHILVATEENNMFTVAGSGGVISSGIVPSYQAQTVPLGISSMGYAGGVLSFGTALPGVLITSGAPVIPNKYWIGINFGFGTGVFS